LKLDRASAADHQQHRVSFRGCVGILLGGAVVTIGLILGWLLVKIIGFGGSVPVVVLMLTQQPQCFSGLGHDADGFGAADIDGIIIAVPG
jgi:NAD/NADP transhydrogenase beta subunit